MDPARSSRGWGRTTQSSVCVFHLIPPFALDWTWDKLSGQRTDPARPATDWPAGCSQTWWSDLVWLQSDLVDYCFVLFLFFFLLVWCPLFCLVFCRITEDRLNRNPGPWIELWKPHRLRLAYFCFSLYCCPFFFLSLAAIPFQPIPPLYRLN